MELKKVGYVYASFNQLSFKLRDYYQLEKIKNNTFYGFKVETNKGINFIVKANEKKFKLDFYDNLDFCKAIYYSIFGYNAAALKKFELHTNLTALSIREYNAIKGGAPYQVFKNDRFETIKKKDHVIIKDNMNSLIHSKPTNQD